MRKRIPTITRPDPTYAAALRPEGQENPGREEEGRAGCRTGAENPAPPEPAGPVPPVLITPGSTSGRSGTIPGEDLSAMPMMPPPVQRTATTRKIDIRVNALARQEAELLACGVAPAQVIRAALRRAVRNWQVGPEFVPPSTEPRSRNTAWRARTSLAVDHEALAALLRAHDPLDVLSKWTLIRGQVEPRVWAEIDALLVQIRADAALQQEAGLPEVPCPKR
ncbi:hypothetical protein GCM10008966_30380 [Rhodovulum strictum]|uniref:Uncharacterized protein n=2 Tax=Rhodovulum strictum TaxID=58314 RepID=A0A844B770_9RHOB|nr:hypothetical protein [Rhodovulum strictum]